MQFMDVNKRKANIDPSSVNNYRHKYSKSTTLSTQ